MQGKNAYLGSIFIPGKYVIRVLFVSPWTSLIPPLAIRVAPRVKSLTSNVYLGMLNVCLLVCLCVCGCFSQGLWPILCVFDVLSWQHIYRIHSNIHPCPLSIHASYFEVINHKIINHLPRSIHNAYMYWVQYDWELAWNWPNHPFLGRSLQQIMKQISAHPKWLI